jgi:hypothetical protein
MRNGNGNLVVRITLDGNPPWDWVECLSHPLKYVFNEAHPSLATVAGDAIIFESSEPKIEDNIKLMDNYIDQANICYCKKLAHQHAEEKRLLGQEQKQQEEIIKINEKLKSL